MKPAIIPADLQGKALFDFAVKHERLIMHAKKSEMKKADGFITTQVLSIDEHGQVTSKAATERQKIAEDANRLKVDLVINTTNYFDSHWDVHIPGLWNKSIADNKQGFYLLDTHGRHFKAVIGEGLSASARRMSWKDLGFTHTGITEALMFSGTLNKERNPDMFDQYAKGYVKQHSVGMRYVRMVTCINDDDYPVQKENWDKYIKQVVNAQEAEEEGIFWAILEAKIIEGSAVLFGSNDLTPAYSVEDASTGNAPEKSTQEQPQPAGFDLSDAIRKTQFINL